MAPWLENDFGTTVQITTAAQNWKTNCIHSACSSG